MFNSYEMEKESNFSFEHKSSLSIDGKDYVSEEILFSQKEEDDEQEHKKRELKNEMLQQEINKFKEKITNLEEENKKLKRDKQSLIKLILPQDKNPKNKILKESLKSSKWLFETLFKKKKQNTLEKAKQVSCILL
jgi:hypothetical protein